MGKRTMKGTGPARLVENCRQTRVIRGPFDPRTTLQKPSHFPSPFDLARPGEYLFLTRVGRQQIGGRVAYAEGSDRVVLILFIPETHSPTCDPQIIQDELARRLGLTLDIGGYEKVWKDDPILSRLPEEMQGARPSSPFSLYEFLVICTVLQNTTVHRTVQMANALAQSLGRTYRFPDGTVLHGFWEPSEVVKLGETKLRELRLGYRAKTLVRFSEQFRTRPELETELLELRNDPSHLRTRVKDIYGVGPASAAYIMFEWFKCIDEFDHVSPWERKILSKLLFEDHDTPAGEIVDFCCARWAPRTMLAVHAVFESIFWRRAQGQGPEWLDELIRL